MTFEGEIYNYAKHRLLAEYFIPNPQNKPVVHHKDGNPLNNNLDNLEWTTYQENNLQRINPIASKTQESFTEEELSNEKWADILDTNYEASSLGRLRNKRTQRINLGSKNKNNGYIRWNLGSQEKQAHRAVYEAFHPNEKIDFINHKDGNRANNRLENLENVSQSQNVLKMYYETKSRKAYPTGQYTSDWKLIKTYPSLSVAAKSIGAYNSSAVRNAWLNKTKLYDFYWKVLSQEEYEEALKNPQIENLTAEEIIERIK